MVIKEVDSEQYEFIYEMLVDKAQQDPLEACFNVTMKVNEAEYILRVQPEKHYKIAALQAILVEREEEQFHTLITNNDVLLALINLLLYQGIR